MRSSTGRTYRLRYGEPVIHGEYDAFMRRKRLIDARKATGKTQEQIAEAVGVDRTTLGKWERDESTPQPGQRPKYAAALGVTLQELDALLDGLIPGARDIPEWLNMYLGMEQSAAAIRAHEPRAVYGLFQTPAYVESMVRNLGPAWASETYLQRILEQRIYRQKRVRSGELNVDVIQPESALHLRIGSNTVMADQLEKMAEMAELPNVTIRVSTYDAGQYEARRLGDFAIMDYPWGSRRVYVEEHGGGRFITESSGITHFVNSFYGAGCIALSPGESRDFILRLAESWRARAKSSDSGVATGIRGTR